MPTQAERSAVVKQERLVKDWSTVPRTPHPKLPKSRCPPRPLFITLDGPSTRRRGRPYFLPVYLIAVRPTLSIVHTLTLQHFRGRPRNHHNWECKTRGRTVLPAHQRRQHHHRCLPHRHFAFGETGRDDEEETDYCIDDASALGRYSSRHNTTHPP
jgi:hypothetical protein